MKTTLRTLIATLIWIPSALAANEASSEGSGFLITLFLGFGALILVFQLAPALVLFGSMIKGLLTRTAKESVVNAEEKGGRTP